ncbi:MAG TPA: hypothetical protein VI792_04225 [Candidatus Eisenbacteria bacterium]
MNVSQLSNLSEYVRSLPPEGAGRHRRLLRLTDLHASAEAAVALEAAAARAREGPGVLAGVLASARAVWRGGLEEHGLPTEDVAERDRLRDAVSSPAFLSLVPGWIRELREIASSRPYTGACTLASALDLWLWTANHFLAGAGSDGQEASDAVGELAEVLCPLLAGRCLALEIAALAPAGIPAGPEWRADLCHVHAAHAAAAAGAACAELVFGYRRHLVWDAEGCAACYGGGELDRLEDFMPGIASGVRAAGDVVEADGTHPAKAGPCVRFDGVDTFTRLRAKLDGCLTGARFARDRAALALARSVVPATTPARASGARA